jgi:hypothetical protein
MLKIILILILSTIQVNGSENHFLIEKNDDMVELTLDNENGCKLFIGVSKPSYSSDSSIKENQAFLIPSSGCNGLLIKSNGEYIKFSTVRKERPHKEFPNIQLSQGAVHFPVSDCAKIKHQPETVGYICAGPEGKLWWIAANGSKREL